MELNNKAWYAGYELSRIGQELVASLSEQKHVKSRQTGATCPITYGLGFVMFVVFMSSVPAIYFSSFPGLFLLHLVWKLYYSPAASEVPIRPYRYRCNLLVSYAISRYLMTKHDKTQIVSNCTDMYSHRHTTQCLQYEYIAGLLIVSLWARLLASYCTVSTCNLRWHWRNGLS